LILDGTGAEPMDRYQIFVALDERFGLNEVSDSSTRSKSTTCRSPQIPTAAPCSFSLFTTVDLWTAVLTSMVLVRQSGYVPTAIQASATTGRSGAERLAQTALVNDISALPLSFN
jgi:hypothetical protein